MTCTLPSLSLPGASDAPALVVLMGLPAHMEKSHRLLTRLAGKRPLLAFAPPEELDDAAPDWAELVERAQAQTQAAGIEHFDLLGWSFGGAWALQWLARGTQGVRRAVLVATSSRFRARERALLGLLQGMLRAELDERVLLDGLAPMMFSPSFLHRPGVFATLRMHMGRGSTTREAWRAGLDNLIAHDVRSALSEMSAVVSVIAGEEDWLFPASESRKLADALPRARYRSLPTGHAMWIENEDAFVSEIHQALTRKMEA